MKGNQYLKIFIIAILLVGANLLHAQQSGPKVAPMPKDAHWVVTFKQPGDEKAAPTSGRELLSIDTVKTGDSRRVTLAYSDGTSDVFDQVRDYLLTSSPEGPQLSMAIADPPSYPFFSNGFLFTDGIETATFVGAEDFQGVPCLRYRLSEGDVLISAETKLPVAAKHNTLTAYFQFLPSPTAPLVLPAEMAALLQRQERAYKAFRDLR